MRESKSPAAADAPSARRGAIAASSARRGAIAASSARRGATATLFVALIFVAPTTALDIRTCGDALGMESGRVTDAQLSASSAFDQLSTGAINGRIRKETGGGAWCPAAQINASAHEWLQIDLGEPHLLTAVETQGRWDDGRGREFAAAYMLEYWRDTLGRWARYRDAHANEIVEGNSDMRATVTRTLDGGVIARLVRLIPVSETTRTVCMRVELYGCVYKDHLASYSMEDGTLIDGLDLRDSAYDGASTPLGDDGGAIWLSGGLGRLFDGVVGADDFEQRPVGWVGWRQRDGDSKRQVQLDLQLTSRRNVSAVLLHTANLQQIGALVFHRARLYFAITDERGDAAAEFSPHFVDTSNSAASNDADTDATRWVRLNVTPARVASRVRIIFDFADDAKWLLFSEIRLEYDSLENSRLTENSWRISDSSYIAVIEQDSGQTTGSSFDVRCYFVGVLFLGGVAVSLATISVFYCIFVVYRRNSQLEKLPHLANLHSKSLMRVIFEDSKNYSIKSSKLRRGQKHQHKSKLVDQSWVTTHNGDHLKTLSSSTTSSTEYADPDLVDHCLGRPLLPKSTSSGTSKTGCQHAGHASYCCSDAPVGSSTSCYDLMCRSVASGSTMTGGSARYRATPCASAFGCRIATAQQSMVSTSSDDAGSTLRGTPPDDENDYALGDDYASETGARQFVSLASDAPTLRQTEDDAFVVLPDFDAASALHDVKRLGVTTRNRIVDVCRMDADRLVGVVSPADAERAADHELCQFHEEMQKLARLRHFNVLRVIGTTSRPLPAYLFEFMPNGDLYQFLRNRASTTSDEVLISFITQIAAGMAYLESCAFVHGALMARNCLVGTDGSVKVGFEALRPYRASGETMTFTNSNNFTAHDDRKPIRWCAWEVLIHSALSTRSDVWAFGVTAWEVFSGCEEIPYATLTEAQLMDRARILAQSQCSTRRIVYDIPSVVPTIPSRCSQFLYEQLMLSCWKLEPTERPSFSELHRMLQSLTFSNIAQKMLNSPNLVAN